MQNFEVTVFGSKSNKMYKTSISAIDKKDARKQAVKLAKQFPHMKVVSIKPEQNI